ncbi:MAG: ATP-binding cassette domain-containing protein [Anaerolineae bacterium]|nr:ATP-binding cassette domain-containing protein [Anaerolineae bacterium]
MTDPARHRPQRGAAEPFLSLEGVTLRLYGRQMFADTWWTMYADEHWAIVGPNGAGKTTLARALCGQVPVVAGRIAYHFPSAGTLPQQRVALVSFDRQRQPLQKQGRFYQARWNRGTQETGMPVAAYLSAPSVRRINPYQVVSEPVDDDRYAARLHAIVSLLAIDDLLERDLIQLSDGERRKVSIARALLTQPALLILDNPFTGLDVSFRAKLERIIGRLMQDPLRVSVLTPRPDEIPLGITHVLSLREGRVVARRRVSPAGTARAVTPTSRSEPSRPVLRPSRGSHGDVLIEMEDVHVRYGHARILSGVSWTVRQGEHWALVGPNGAGKTTLLSLIQGDHPQAYANRISLFGQRRGSGESIWQIKAHIGWVSPELHLYYPLHAPCLDVVCSGFRDSIGLYRAPSDDERRTALSWLERLGLGHAAARRFGALSEGQQRLALLARALVKRPQLLVLDEPCQGLDPDNQRRILQNVDEVGARSGTSVIYVTHDPRALPGVISHLLRLDRGSVVYRGRIEGDARRAGKRHTLGT